MVTRSWILALVFLVGFGAVPDLGHAQGQDGPRGVAEGAPFLLFPTGARAVGLGGAVTALASPEAAYWNPAGLAGLEGGRVLLMRGEHISGDALGLSIQYGWSGVGVVGLGYQLLDEGTLDATDQEGNIIGSFTLRNHLAVVTLATSLGSRFHMGGNLKYPRFELGCRGQCPEGRVRSSSVAVDLGIRGRPSTRLPLDLGASLRHLGPDFRTRDAEEGAPPPSRIRLGGAWEPWARMIEDERLAVLVSLDVEDRLRDLGNPAVVVGAEFSAGTDDRVYIRGGYTLVQATGLEGAAAGFGLRLDRFELELARTLPRGAIVSQQEPVHLTLAVRF
jgi:hypothetical protein